MSNTSTPGRKRLTSVPPSGNSLTGFQKSSMVMFGLASITTFGKGFCVGFELPAPVERSSTNELRKDGKISSVSANDTIDRNSFGPSPILSLRLYGGASGLAME